MITREPNHSTGCEGRAAWQLLATARTVLIATHANPDADAVASILALRLALAEVVSNVICLTGDGLVPSSLSFLPAADLLIRDPATVHETPDCIALLDCADPSRLGPFFHLHSTWFEGQIPMVNIDHHITNTHFGHVDLIDPNAASTTEILAQWFLTVGVTITPDIATCLLTGLYGDTLSFQTTSTSVRALELAALLLRLGARHEEIVNNLFRRKPVSTIRLWGAALSGIRVEPPLIWTEITRDMLHETGATPLEGEGIVNFLSGAEGTVVSLLFYEQPEGWRVSLRSADSLVDVAQLCQRYGGGGHPRAAGCRLPPGEAARRAFLNDLRAMVTELLATRPHSR